MATYVCTDELFLNHRPLGEHPERPERLQAILGALAASELRGRYRQLAPRPATDEELQRVHTADYLHDLRKRMGDHNPKGSGWLDPDTYYGPGTYKAALNAAGIKGAHQIIVPTILATACTVTEPEPEVGTTAADLVGVITSHWYGGCSSSRKMTPPAIDTKHGPAPGTVTLEVVSRFTGVSDDNICGGRYTCGEGKTAARVCRLRMISDEPSGARK